MKKVISLLLCMALLLAAVCAFANEEKEITVLINGEKVEFDVAPVIVNDRTLVPIRAVCEKLGADVEWFEYDKYRSVIIVKNNTKMILSIDVAYFTTFECENYDDLSKKISENGTSSVYKEVELDAAPTIIDGRTLLPIRAVCETLGAEVSYIEDSRTVDIKCSEEIIANKNKDRGFFHEFTSPIKLSTARKKARYPKLSELTFTGIDGENYSTYKNLAEFRLNERKIADYTISRNADENKMIVSFTHPEETDVEEIKSKMLVFPQFSMCDGSGTAFIDNSHIDNTSYSLSKETKKYSVVINLTDNGKKILAEKTAEIVNAEDKTIKIKLDGGLVSSAQAEKVYDDGVVVINGEFTELFAKKFADALTADAPEFKGEVQVITKENPNYKPQKKYAMISEELYTAEIEEEAIKKFGDTLSLEKIKSEKFDELLNLVVSNGLPYIIFGSFDESFIAENSEHIEEHGVLSGDISFIKIK